MSAIDKLTEYFEQFPGIGPRQAKRFVYFLLKRDRQFLDEFSRTLSKLKDEVTLCQSCFRFFVSPTADATLCTICRNSNRDTGSLMLVEKDADLENIERSGAYNGHYFVLGGSIPVLSQEPERRIRSRELTSHVTSRAEKKELKEVIFALPNTSEGDTTARFLNELLTPLSIKYNFKIAALGRGLSTGTELEYSDSDTIKNALSNRN